MSRPPYDEDIARLLVADCGRFAPSPKPKVPGLRAAFAVAVEMHHPRLFAQGKTAWEEYECSRSTFYNWRESAAEQLKRSYENIDGPVEPRALMDEDQVTPVRLRQRVDDAGVPPSNEAAPSSQPAQYVEKDQNVSGDHYVAGDSYVTGTIYCANLVQAFNNVTLEAQSKTEGRLPIPPPTGGATRKWYVVFRGHKRGVFYAPWDGADGVHKLVWKYPGSSFKCCKGNEAQAHHLFAEYNAGRPSP